MLTLTYSVEIACTVCFYHLQMSLYFTAMWCVNLLVTLTLYQWTDLNMKYYKRCVDLPSMEVNIKPSLLYIDLSDYEFIGYAHTVQDGRDLNMTYCIRGAWNYPQWSQYVFSSWFWRLKLLCALGCVWIYWLFSDIVQNTRSLSKHDLQSCLALYFLLFPFLLPVLLFPSFSSFIYCLFFILPLLSSFHVFPSFSIFFSYFLSSFLTFRFSSFSCKLPLPFLYVVYEFVGHTLKSCT